MLFGGGGTDLTQITDYAFDCADGTDLSQIADFADKAGFALISDCALVRFAVVCCTSRCYLAGLAEMTLLITLMTLILH
jgi:hypothetical protein